jgi:hypothetical protein
MKEFGGRIIEEGKKEKGLSHTIQREGKFDVVLPQRRREKRKRSHTSKEQN